MTKALISVTGLDATGIIACVATKLSEMNINILDITQTILDGYFTMMMVVDLDGAQRPFAEIDETIASINTLDENIGKYSSRNRIRKIYDHYLPLLIKIMNNYNTIDFIEDTERKTGARKELVDTIDLINTALGSLTDSSDEDSPDMFEAEVSEAEKLLEKVEKKA